MMVFDSLASIQGSELLGQDIVPDYIATQEKVVQQHSNITGGHWCDHLNHSIHNHSEHMTGLYTRDGRRVIVNKDKSDEEDDVSSINMLLELFN